MSVVDLAARDLFWKVRTDARRADVELGTRAGVFPYFVPIGSPLGREVVVDGRPRLMFGSNNYLGLADDPRVIAAAQEATARFGTGCTGSRLMNGTLELHLELEDALARWMRRDAALVFTAGYLANLATIATLCGPADVVVGDARNHASIEDGARLSGARTVTIRHADLGQLEKKLARLDAPALVVWDSVFSMEGDAVDADALTEIARAAGARTLLDEAHSLGVLGPDAAGVAAGMDRPPDLVMGTFSKSLASCGGVIAGDRDVIEHLRVHARPFVFTASAVPAAVAAARTAIDLAVAEPWRAARAVATARRLADGLAAEGYEVSGGTAAIVGVRVRDEWHATNAWRALFDAGIYVNVGVFPAVPRGEAIMRLSTTAQHTPEDVDRCVREFARVVPR
ncbi:MAG: aminotransferase class I/II-fold pyridoxal phosphate-dependent enzyme [Acidimicrobiia bacterium]